MIDKPDKEPRAAGAAPLSPAHAHPATALGHSSRRGSYLPTSVWVAGVALPSHVPVGRLRATHGWSQEVLAELAGLHRSYISGIERTTRNVSLDNIEKIALAFGVSMEELWRE